MCSGLYKNHLDSDAFYLPFSEWKQRNGSPYKHFMLLTKYTDTNFTEISVH